MTLILFKTFLLRALCFTSLVFREFNNESVLWKISENINVLSTTENLLWIMITQEPSLR